MKQTTYLATLPNPNLKANGMSLLLKVVAEVIDPVMASLGSARRIAEGLRPVLFSPCVAPAAPVQHVGTPVLGTVRCGILSFS